MNYVAVDLSRILITDTSDQQVIWLKERGGDRSFPIVIGIFEAVAIKRKLSEESLERPLTHDLMANMISELGASVEKILVTALKNTTFFATIVLRRGEDVVEVDSRPSDAIALSVRVNAPLFVSEDVLDKVGKPEAKDEE